MKKLPVLIVAVGLSLGVSGHSPAQTSNRPAIFLPTNQLITPTAARGATETVVMAGADSTQRQIGQINRAILSPDGTLMVALSSGFNRYFGNDGQIDLKRSAEAALVYELHDGTARLTQTIDLPNTFLGMTFNDDGSRLFISGGKDDVVYRFHRDGKRFSADEPAIALQSGTSLSLDLALHNNNIGALTAGVASLHHGEQLLVNLFEHDAVDLLDTMSGKVLQRLDLRPGKNAPKDVGKPGGEYPLDVVAVSDNRAFIASVRDRELVVLHIDSDAHADKPLRIATRLPLPGQPLRLIRDQSGAHIFVSVDNADQVLVFDTNTLKLLFKTSTRLAPLLGQGTGQPGAISNNLALSSDERTLYVSNAGDNAVVAFHIDWREKEFEPIGALPTGWYPSALVADPTTNRLFVFNAKTPSSPNPDNCKSPGEAKSRAAGCDTQIPVRARNQYSLQLIHSSLLTIPLPNKASWSELTQQVARNNGYHQTLTLTEQSTVQFLQKHIRHVIYVVRENRTFDQILGDLPNAEADASRAQFPRQVTPNAHRLADQFSTLDHYFCSGDVSMNGWQWSTAGRVTDINEKTTFLNYGKRGASYDSEGGTRGINLASGNIQERVRANPLMATTELTDPDLLPGARNPVEVDSPAGQPGAGYLWSSALKAGKSVRNYGFFVDLTRYDSELAKHHPDAAIAPMRNPRAQQTIVAYPTHEQLIGRTDPYFLGFDTRVPDYYRVQEWQSEFTEFEHNGKLPALSLVRLMMDHTGSFKETLDSVNTPELQIADNDYALGLLIEKVAHSRYAKDTLIVITEDDAQDGPDHVDSHRSPAFIVGPYTQLSGKVIARPYTTVNLLRTIEVVLGLAPNNARDAYAHPILEAFDIRHDHWDYTAEPSPLLYQTQLPLPKVPTLSSQPWQSLKPLHDADWWDQHTHEFDFSSEDKLDAERYNRILWLGTMGDAPYPPTP
jgi:DNA-binding beta-propeller fold protein YncE